VQRRVRRRRDEGKERRHRKPHSRGFSTLGHVIMSRMNDKPPICYNCKKDGHLGKTCPMPKKPARKTCHHCGVYGHCIEHCPSSDLSRANARRAVRLAASIDDTVLRNSAQASDSAILCAAAATTEAADRAPAAGDLAVFMKGLGVAHHTPALVAEVRCVLWTLCTCLVVVWLL
jgi:hypothetical protein